MPLNSPGGDASHRTVGSRPPYPPGYPPPFLTIGEFARASRLSPKALRLYDELGLLRPVRVDEYSGYR